MPIYEYQCDACGNRFETIQKFSDPPLEICPSCGGSVRKLQAAPAFQFKGSGWYITDYARKESAAPAKDDSKPDAKADGSAENKAETKSDGKSGPAPAKIEPKSQKEEGRSPGKE